MECIEAIREYRDNKDKYLPLIDHEKKALSKQSLLRRLFRIFHE